MRVIAIAIISLVTGFALAQAADAPQVTIAPVAKTDTTADGKRIEIPAHPHVIVTVATFPPGAALPEHRHPYPHYMYVLEGTLTITDTDAHRTFTAKAGDFLVETTGWHFGKNNGGEPVKLLGIDQLPDGVNSNRVLKK